MYALTTEITKQVDRYEIGKPKYTVIDLEQQKIARTADLAPEDERASGGGRGGGFQISPDGKYLYQFRDSVVILNTSDFKVVDRLPHQAGFARDRIDLVRRQWSAYGTRRLRFGL